MTINMVAELQKYRVSNTYNVGVEYYSDGDCLLDLDEMLASWLVQLRGQRKSKHTQRIYRTAVQSFLAFCDEYELPRALTKPAVLAYMASRSGEASTAQLHLRVLKLFARWLHEEEGYDPAGVVSVKSPKVDQPAVPDMQEDEIRRMLKACAGTTLRDRRDKAMLSLLAETGMPAQELVDLDVPDIDIAGCVAHVRRGKGGKGRRVRFSPATAALIDRYTCARGGKRACRPEKARCGCPYGASAWATWASCARSRPAPTTLVSTGSTFTACGTPRLCGGSRAGRRLASWPRRGGPAPRWLRGT